MSNTNDLISRQAAIDELFALYEYQRSIDPTEAADLVRQGVFLAEKKIEDLPSVDAVEVVRCKDCKHRPLDGEDTQGFDVEFPDEKCPCQCDDGFYNWRPDDDWFCGNAER